MLFFLSIFIAQIFVPPPPYQTSVGTYEKSTVKQRGRAFTHRCERLSETINEKEQIFVTNGDEGSLGGLIVKERL
ncbi:5439_t:CDS:2 [Acaulospora morrowiae]|uniref:5439_t:CDS:1 n=1 Tax=Acaulospora morrowiae TaxID=94023 RepID=A0A9N9ADM7_9GLOM|nr:5439_t:CDS:2 [Acaulospora morrowiae]